MENFSESLLESNYQITIRKNVEHKKLSRKKIDFSRNSNFSKSLSTDATTKKFSEINKIEYLTLKKGEIFNGGNDDDEILLDTQLEDKISSLIDELCEYFRIDDKEYFNFFIISAEKILNFKFLQKYPIYKIFQNFDYGISQEFKLRISPKFENKDHSNYSNLICALDNISQQDIIYSKNHLIKYLNNKAWESQISNSLDKCIKLIGENYNFLFDEFLYYTINHFLEENSETNFKSTSSWSHKFFFKPLKINKLNFTKTDNEFLLRKNYIKKYFSIYRIMINVSNLENLFSFFLFNTQDSPKFKINNLYLTFSNVNRIEDSKSNFSLINTKIFEINFLKITFINCNQESIQNIVSFFDPKNFKICVQNLNLKFKKISDFKISHLILLINNIAPHNEEKINLHIKLNSFKYKHEENFFLPYKNTSHHQVNLLSLRIKDKFTTISQFLEEFIENFLLKFNLQNFTILHFEHLRIYRNKVLRSLLNFFTILKNKSLKKLILKNNKIQTDNDFNFLLDKEKGIRFNNIEEKNNINNLRKFNSISVVLKNSKLLRLHPNDLLRFCHSDENLKFDLKSVKNFDKKYFPYDKFIKKGDAIKINLSSKVYEAFYDNIFELPDNITAISLKNEISLEEFINYIEENQNESEDTMFISRTDDKHQNFFFKNILTKHKIKKLKNLKMLNLCANKFENEDKIIISNINTGLIKNLKYFYLNSRSSEFLDLHNFFKIFNGIQKLTLGDLLINYGEKEYKNIRCEIKTLSLKFSLMKELSFLSRKTSNDIRNEKYIDSMKNLFTIINNNLEIKNLVISKSTLNFFKDLLQIDDKDEINISEKFNTQIKNLIFYNTLSNFTEDKKENNDILLLTNFFFFPENEKNAAIKLNNFCIFQCDANFSPFIINLLNQFITKEKYGAKTFSQLKIDTFSLKNIITYKTSYDSIISILNGLEDLLCYTKMKDSESIRIKNQILDNFEILSILKNFTHSDRKISIYYKSDKELFEFFILFEISSRIKSLRIDQDTNLDTKIKNSFQNLLKGKLFKPDITTDSKITSINFTSSFLENINQDTLCDLKLFNFIKEKKIKKIIHEICNE